MDMPEMELFIHVRVLIGVILGLSVGKLLTGLARFVEHPNARITWWVHIGWVLWALLSVIAFWWWEFQLIHLSEWTFGVYLFIFAYACSYFLICTILFPDSIKEYANYQAYFLSRRRWFFGLVALAYVLDAPDTWLKGADYVEQMGPLYIAHSVAMLIICGVGAVSTNTRVQGALVVIALAIQSGYFFFLYDRIA